MAEQGGLADHHPGNTRCWPQCVKTTSPVQGGTITQERTTPQQMRFNSSSSFQLLFGGEQFSQSYSCSKLLAAGEQEVRLQLFSQSQVGRRKSTLSFFVTLCIMQNTLSIHLSIYYIFGDYLRAF